MSFGIYKQGQGYWVRTMTAVFAGILFLVAAAWAWDQAQSIDLPPKAYELSIEMRTEGQTVPSAGANVVLEREGTDGSMQRLATAIVSGYGAATRMQGTLTVTQIQMLDETASISQADRVAVDDMSAPFVAQVTGRLAIPLIPDLYLQAAVAGAIIFVGAIVIYWLVGVRHGTVDFLVATDGEMKKVNWSTRKEIIGSTQVVIVAAILIASILFIIDLAFSNFFKLIGVLEG